MTKLKTLKDLHTKCKWFPDCNQECVEIDIDELKQEAIKRFKHYEKLRDKCNHVESMWNYYAGRCDELEENFNITEEDLK